MIHTIVSIIVGAIIYEATRQLTLHDIRKGKVEHYYYSRDKGMM